MEEKPAFSLPRKYENLSAPNLGVPESSKQKHSKLEVSCNDQNELKIYLDVCKKGLTLVKNSQGKKDYHSPDQIGVFCDLEDADRRLWNRPTWDEFSQRRV